MKICPGDIYLINCGANKKSNIINGYRPAIVIKTMCNSTVVHVIPLTTSEKRHVNRLHVKIEGHGLIKPSIALIEQMRLMDKSLLDKRIGSIAGTEKMDEVVKRLVSYFQDGAA